jgi:Beta-galactosidase
LGVGEFGWLRLEPVPREIHLNWLELAITNFGTACLKVYSARPRLRGRSGCSTATPEVLAWDCKGRPRGFGLRRHRRQRSELSRGVRPHHPLPSLNGVDLGKTVFHVGHGVVSPVVLQSRLSNSLFLVRVGGWTAGARRLQAA